MRIFALETSCDETAAAVVQDGWKVLGNAVASSMALHAQTGGVVPEVAAREHALKILPVIKKALTESGLGWEHIDAIAVTHAPGLLTSLLVGVNAAQALALVHQKPLIPVHHVAGHIYANRLGRTADFNFPALVLTASGGHSELVLLKGHWDFEVLGETLDDAAGEAFDKIARLLGLGYPGGPAIATLALLGNPKAHVFPQAELGEARPYDFSFSGLKSAVRRLLQKTGEGITERQKADIASSAQEAIVDALVQRLADAAQKYKVTQVHIAGGVSANERFREKLAAALSHKITVVLPEKKQYCTDNAAMIGAAAYFLVQKHPRLLKKPARVPVLSQLALSKAVAIIAP